LRSSVIGWDSLICGGNSLVGYLGDEELKNFLAEEIKTETKNRRGGPLPTTLDGFSIKTDRSDVTLTKNLNDERYCK